VLFAQAAEAGIEAATNEWSFTVNEKLITLAIGVLLPVVYGIVMKTTYMSEKVKAFIGIVLGGLATLCYQAIEAATTDGQAFFTTELLYRWAWIQIPMWAAYWGLWKSLDVNHWTKGVIGPSSAKPTA
jgi:hypothetical protein